MGMGTLLLASLLLAAEPGQGERVAVNDRSFQIPVSFDPARRAQIKEVILFESADQGKQWNQRAVNQPTKENFNVSVPADGAYWFTICIVGQDGKRLPSEPSKADRIMKLLVDTKRPEILLKAARQGEGVVADWSIHEENPKLATLKLEYRTADMPAGQWVPVKIDPQLSGRVGFPLQGASGAAVRMEIKDEADNVGKAEAEVPAAPPQPGTPFPTTQPVAAQGADGGSGSPFAAQTTGMLRNQSRSLQDPLDPPPPGAGALPGAAPTGGTGQSGGVLAATGPQNPPLGPPPVAPATAPPISRGPLPALEYVNTNRVTLNYEVDKVGASGIGSVELYVTRDDGNTWQRLTGETTNALPSPTVQPGPRSISAELPGEGRYGFYLVVRSGVGLGKQAPRNGERPQMRVEVDLTPPEGTLYGLQPAPGQRDTVIIRWAAKDANLTEKPIRLEWAERKNGPWKVIGDGDLANTGQYPWKLPQDIPAIGKVYLKMTIADLARNTGVAESAEPVTIDLNEPEVKILGLGRGGP